MGKIRVLKGTCKLAANNARSLAREKKNPALRMFKKDKHYVEFFQDEARQAIRENPDWKEFSYRIWGKYPFFNLEVKVNLKEQGLTIPEAKDLIKEVVSWISMVQQVEISFNDGATAETGFDYGSDYLEELNESWETHYEPVSNGTY